MNAYQFFLRHAGYSWRADSETQMQGRIRCARALAKAEREARNASVSFAWGIDFEINSSDFSDEEPAWDLWNCTMFDAQGRVRGSLCGIDFGRDGSPYGDPYKRVVEAELFADCPDDLTA